MNPHGAAEIGQLNPLRVSFEQGRAEGIFQIADRFGQGGWDTAQDSAALVKFRVSATARKYRIWLKFMWAHFLMAHSGL
jgi:hypothetical protein